jgi:hypothetical protein
VRLIAYAFVIALEIALTLVFFSVALTAVTGTLWLVGAGTGVQALRRPLHIWGRVILLYEQLPDLAKWFFGLACLLTAGAIVAAVVALIEGHSAAQLFKFSTWF